MLNDITVKIILEIAVVIGAALGAYFVYLQNKNKNKSDVEIAKINVSGASDLEALKEAFEKIKALESELKLETTKRRESEQLRMESERKCLEELNERDIRIVKLQESIVSIKVMLRITLTTVERQYEGSPDRSELIGTFKEIHAYLNKDSNF